jgi:hypothetical protein
MRVVVDGEESTQQCMIGGALERQIALAPVTFAGACCIGTLEELTPQGTMWRHR